MGAETSRADDETSVDALAVAIFEAEEDENDDACAKGCSAAFIGARTAWNDPINHPVHDGFRARARRILAHLPAGFKA